MSVLSRLFLPKVYLRRQSTVHSRGTASHLDVVATELSLITGRSEHLRNAC